MPARCAAHRTPCAALRSRHPCGAGDPSAIHLRSWRKFPRASPYVLLCLFYDRKAAAALHHLREPAILEYREDQDRDAVFPRQRNCRRVHHFEVACQYLAIIEPLETVRLGVAQRVGIVDAIDLGRLQQGVTPHFGCPQRGRRIGGEKRVAGAGAEDDDPPLFQMAQGTPPDVRLANRLHRDCRLDPGRDAAALQLVLHGQRVYHRGQHAHVVARGALHADRSARQTAEDVTAADYQAQLDPEHVDRPDLLGDAADHGGVEPVIALAHQRFARNFEKDATILQIGRHASGAHRLKYPPSRAARRYTKLGPPQRNLTCLVWPRSRDQLLSCAPISPAKSGAGRSTPSPSAKRTNPATRIGFPAALAAASTTLPTRVSPSITKTWSSSTTSS